MNKNYDSLNNTKTTLQQTVLQTTDNVTTMLCVTKLWYWLIMKELQQRSNSILQNVQNFQIQVLVLKNSKKKGTKATWGVPFQGTNSTF